MESGESKERRERSCEAAEDRVENSRLMIGYLMCLGKSIYSTSRICRRGVIRTGLAQEKENTGVE